MGYDFDKIEKKWEDYWIKNKVYKTDAYDFSKKKFYIMEMFPYPSALGLHVGHVEGYTAGDALARMKRAQGYNVLHPIGYDAFGLPAEQFAIKNNKHPSIYTDNNIDNFRNQLQRLGFSYDWDREIKTTDPKYYKWTQYIFTLMFKEKLAYEDNRLVNYCPALGTVLANEEVIDGKSERGNHPVIRKPMRQWVLKITAYADKLLSGLKLLNWPESTLTMQRNWIGKSQGTIVKFKVENSDEIIEVFTTRADTLFGCTYVVLAPEHPLTKSLTTEKNRKAVDDYLESIKSKSDMERTDGSKEKTGVFLGSYAINPINQRRVPIYTGDYVLATYATGAVMAVPCHDQRDYEFAKKHGIEMIQVIEGDTSISAYEGDGKHINSSFADSLNNEEAKKAISEKLIENGDGYYKTSYKLRDWLFSRQRYWGEPIPVIHYDDGEVEVLSKDELPLVLPEVDDYQPTMDGKPPLEKAKEWMNVSRDGKSGKRESNTMPQWAGSSWYYLRYIDPHNDDEIADKKLLDHWLPVDVYIGGAEHAVLHLLYARFWHKFLKDQGIVSCEEPFLKLFHQGMILGPDGQKMSKSAGNTVSPDQVIKDYGADALRFYEMFKGPVDQSLPWNNDGPKGAKKFLDRVYRLFTEEEFIKKYVEDDSSLDYLYNYTVKKVTEDYEILHFNTAIAQLMILVNEFFKAEKLSKKKLTGFIKLLAPVAPHIASECYTIIGHEDLIDYSSWPTYDESKITLDEVTYAVQVNGKVRANVSYKKDASKDEQEELKNKVLNLDSVKKYTDSHQIVKVIVVLNKIVSIVIK